MLRWLAGEHKITRKNPTKTFTEERAPHLEEDEEDEEGDDDEDEVSGGVGDDDDDADQWTQCADKVLRELGYGRVEYVNVL